MKKIGFFTGICLCFIGRAETLKTASFLDFYSAYGKVFNTNEFTRDCPIPRYEAFSLRYARASKGTSWKDFTFNMPYFGVGIYKPFFNRTEVGNPFAIYAFRGSTLKQFTDNLGLNLEINLGLSMNWKTYDPIDNPENVAISTPTNAHVGLRMYFDYAISKHFDLKFGADLNHISNGANCKPNRGLNMGALSFSLAYNFNPPNNGFLLRNPTIELPEKPRHTEHNTQFIISYRRLDFLKGGPNLSTPYPDKKFNVLGLVYTPMMVRNYKYKWGPSVRLIYDESARAKAWGKQNSVDGSWYDHIELSDFSNRLSLGFGLTGEISVPIASFFASLGYSVYNRHHEDRRFFQVIGTKVYLYGNFFGTFGISATDFSVAQFLYWSVGYTFSSVPRKK
jgi:hypothetical protein